MSKGQKTQKQAEQKSLLKKTWQRKKLRIIFIVIGIYVLSLFIPLISPFTQYPLHLVKCGKQPIVASNFAGGRSYRLPGDYGYGVHPFISEYFCTEGEASAGYYYRATQ